MNSATPTIRFVFRDSRFYLGKRTLRELGNPPYLKILWNKDEAVLFLKAETKKSRDALRVPDYFYANTDHKYRFGRAKFTEAIRVRMGWDVDATYRVKGEVFKEHAIARFVMAEAEYLGTGELYAEDE